MKRMTSLFMAMALAIAAGAENITVPTSDYMVRNYVTGSTNLTGTALTNFLAGIPTTGWYNLIFDGGTWAIDTNVSFPTNCTIAMAPDTSFDVASGQVMTFAGNPLAAAQQVIFRGSGTATGSCFFVYRWPQWGDEGRFRIGDGILANYLGINSLNSNLTFYGDVNIASNLYASGANFNSMIVSNWARLNQLYAEDIYCRNLTASNAVTVWSNSALVGNVTAYTNVDLGLGYNRELNVVTNGITNVITIHGRTLMHEAVAIGPTGPGPGGLDNLALTVNGRVTMRGTSNNLHGDWWITPGTGDVSRSYRLNPAMTTNYTVSTFAELRSTVADIPQWIPSMVTVTVNIASGTLTQDDNGPVFSDGHFGGGTLRIIGDTSTNSGLPFSTQSVVIVTSNSANANCFQLNGTTRYEIQGIHFKNDGATVRDDNDFKSCIRMDNVLDFDIGYCYFEAGNTNSDIAVGLDGASGLLHHSQIKGHARGLWAIARSLVSCDNNTVISQEPLFANRSRANSLVSFTSTNNWTGASADISLLEGGSYSTNFSKNLFFP